MESAILIIKRGSYEVYHAMKSERVMEMDVKDRMCGIIRKIMKVFSVNTQKIEDEKNKAFIEGYCYAIRVLEDNMVKDRQDTYFSDLDMS